VTVKANQKGLHARLKALPWIEVPTYLHPRAGTGAGPDAPSRPFKSRPGSNSPERVTSLSFDEPRPSKEANESKRSISPRPPTPIPPPWPRAIIRNTAIALIRLTG
jgi:hypothetical protein